MLLLSCLLFLVSAQTQPCFPKELGNLTNISNCTLRARQNQRCAYPDMWMGITYFYMFCDGSENYNLQTEVFGDKTHLIQISIQNMMANLSSLYDTKVTVNCLTVAGGEYAFFCAKRWRDFDILTCTITTQNETIPEFPEYFTCSSDKYNISILSIISLCFFFLLL